MWDLFWSAAREVAVWALILGAGLPALFALGVRSTLLANAQHLDTTTSGAAVHTSVPPLLNRIIGLVCFALVIAAVVFGLTVIVATGLGKEVSFSHVYPTVHDKA